MNSITLSKTAHSGTRFQRRGADDTYDSFSGADLALVAGGVFRDRESQEQTDTVEVSRQAATEVERQIAKAKSFKKAKARPEAERTVETERYESFRGLTLGRGWRIGPYTVRTESRTSTVYKVDAELETGPITARTTLSVSQPEPARVTEQAGWYFFS